MAGHGGTEEVLGVPALDRVEWRRAGGGEDDGRGGERDREAEI